MCDCPRVSGNEQYWDGTQCILAGAYNVPCLSAAANPNYQCQELTLTLQCSGGFCVLVIFLIV